MRPLGASWLARAAAALGLHVLLATHLGAQGGAEAGRDRSRWSFAVTGGGAYALSDLEIVPGIDQNGGWGADVGIRAQRGRASLGIGLERTRFLVGPEGSSTASSLYGDSRLALGGSTLGVHPFVFAQAGRVVDYDVTIGCCSVYSADSNARGWVYGGGFGIMSRPLGGVRLDLSAGVHRLSAKTPASQSGTWKSAGPVTRIRLGASIPF